MRYCDEPVRCGHSNKIRWLILGPRVDPLGGGYSFGSNCVSVLIIILEIELLQVLILNEISNYFLSKNGRELISGQRPNFGDEKIFVLITSINLLIKLCKDELFCRFKIHKHQRDSLRSCPTNCSNR